jgi:hypothetical protein
MSSIAQFGTGVCLTTHIRRPTKSSFIYHANLFFLNKLITFKPIYDTSTPDLSTSLQIPNTPPTDTNFAR